MHPNPLLDPRFWNDVGARQREPLSAALRCRGEWHGNYQCVSTAAGSVGLAIESEAAYTPEKLRAA
jgi:hypothetical protein